MHAPVNSGGISGPLSVSYAGLLQRAAAIFVDTVLLFGIGEILAAIGIGPSFVSTLFDPEGVETGPGEIVRFILAASYFVVLNGRGATLGKRLLGIRVVDELGRPPGLRKGAIRYIIPAAAEIIPMLIDEPPGSSGVSVISGTGLTLILTTSVISLFDDLSMLWHPRRQTFHDRMAGTFVVPVVNGQLAPPGHSPARLGPVVAIVITFVLLCVASILIAFPHVDEWLEEGRENVANVMATSLETSCTETLQDDGIDRGTVQLRERDLTVNNAAAVGEVGWESGTDGTIVYGMELGFESERITLDAGPSHQYSGAPIVNGGRIELVDIQAPEETIIVASEGFERAIEEGLNRCLDAHGLVPTALEIDGNMMIIRVEAS